MDRAAENVSERNSEDLSHLNNGGDSTEITHMAEVVPPDALTTALAELPPSLALKVRDSYAQEFQRVAELEKQARAIVVTDEGQTVEMRMAGVLRCHLVKLRTGIDKKRKSLNDDARAWTLANNGAANAVTGVIALLESHLRDQETFGERRAAERMVALHASRTAQLVALGVDPNTYRFENASEQAFADVLADVRALQAAKAEAARRAEVARLEAERLAAEAREAERLERARLDAERLERERVQAEENARLKAEAAERDRLDAIREEALRIEREAAAAIAKAEREERDRERQRAEAAARIEREKVEEQARKAREENDALLRRLAEAERVEREKAEAIAREAKAKADREAEVARQAALAPDREKLSALAAQFLALANGEEVTLRLPTFSTPEGIESGTKVRDQVAKLAAGTKRLGGAK